MDGDFNLAILDCIKFFQETKMCQHVKVLCFMSPVQVVWSNFLL